MDNISLPKKPKILLDRHLKFFNRDFLMISPGQMEEKRISKRFVIKLFVRYADYHADHLRYVGFTVDISKTGLNIKSNKPYPKNTDLKFKLSLPNGQMTELTGKVSWCKAISPEESGTELVGMGIRILKAEDGFNQFVKSLLTPPAK